MKNCLRAELWKATHNKMFYTTILIGTLIVALNVWEVHGSMQSFLDRIMDEPYGVVKSAEGYSLFMEAMPFGVFGFSAELFYFIWPILATMPFAGSYLKEHREGISSQIISRCNVGTYFFSKYMAIFITGGIAILFPTVLDVLLCALISPSYVPTVGMSGLDNRYFLAHLFYTHPWGYFAAWLPIIFIWGGVTAGLALVAGCRFRHTVFALLLPYCLYFIFTAVQSVFFPAAATLSPMMMVRPTSSLPIYASVLFGGAALVAVISLGVGYWQVKRNEKL